MNAVKTDSGAVLVITQWGLQDAWRLNPTWTARKRERATGRPSGSETTPLKPKSGLNGPPRLTTTSTGAVRGSYSSLPFGDGFTTTSGGDDSPFDDFAGLTDFSGVGGPSDRAQFRVYSPAQGRWMSPDPYSGSYDFNNPQSFNRYSYVMNNPLTFNDPSGQDGGACGVGVVDSVLTLNPAGLLGCVFDAWFFDSLFGGGPSFHGSLKPRPSTPSDPGSFGESLGIPTSIPQGNWGIGLALNLPEACEFGACGGGVDSFMGGSGSPFRKYNCGLFGNCQMFPLNLPFQLSWGSRARTWIKAHREGIIGAFACAFAPDAVSDIRNLQHGHLYNSPSDDSTGGGGPGPLYPANGPNPANDPMGSTGGAAGMNGAAAGLDYANAVGGCLQKW